MIFRGTRDGFKAIIFHKNCDNQGPNLTIIKSELGKVFGGYTDIPQGSASFPGASKLGKGNTILFSLKDDMNFVKMRFIGKSAEIRHNDNILCCFGS